MLTCYQFLRKYKTTTHIVSGRDWRGVVIKLIQKQVHHHE